MNNVRGDSIHGGTVFTPTPDCSSFSSSSPSVQTAYHKTGVSNRSNSFTKIIYIGVYMILDAQNLHTFSQSRQTPCLQLYSVSFRHHFLVCSRAQHVKLVLCTNMQTFSVRRAAAVSCAVLSFLATLLRYFE